jgi:hypothetical protein
VTVKDEDTALKLSEDDSSSDESFSTHYHQSEAAEEFGAPPKIFSKFGGARGGAVIGSAAVIGGLGATSAFMSHTVDTGGGSFFLSGSNNSAPGPSGSSFLFKQGSSSSSMDHSPSPFFSLTTGMNVQVEPTGLFSPSQSVFQTSAGTSDGKSTNLFSPRESGTAAGSIGSYGDSRLSRREALGMKRKHEYKKSPEMHASSDVYMSSSDDSESPPGTFRERSTSPDSDV